MADLPPLPPPAPRRTRILVYAIVGVVIAILAVVGWRLMGSGEGGGQKAAADGKGGKGASKGGKGGAGRFAGGAGGVQPVAAATAKIGNVNIVQTGLGTATALRTVTVKPRVDGQLASVTYVEGQLVPAGQTLAQIDPVPFQVALSQAEGQLARDAAQLNNARLDLARYETLLQQDSIAKQQVDQQASLVKQLEGTVKMDQANVDNARLNLSYTNITAPLGGRLGLRQVDPGNMVRTSDANGVAVITQVDPMSVVFTIPQDVLPKVLQRLNAGDKPPVEAWDREQKTLLAKGVLLTTDNQIDVATGTVKLKAQFANPKGAMFPNQFLNVRMVIDTVKNVVVVPTAAVQRGTQGNVVYVVKDDNTVTLRPVATGPTEGQDTAIMSGLQAGERVVTDGIDRLREGSKVEVTEPGAGLRQGPPGPGDDAARREELRKRLEAMTPVQREEAKRRFQERQRLDAAPPAQPAPLSQPAQSATPGSPSAPPPRSDASSDERRKRFESLTPEQREEMKKRFQNMTPEQREEFRKRREAAQQ